MTLTSFLLFLGGLVVLAVGAEGFVRGASRLARAFGISPLIIGLTVVSFGTSAPELAVSVRAGLEGQPDLALGNVIGSNIFNVLFILGVSALILPLLVSRQLIRAEVPVLIGASVLLLFLAGNGWIGQAEGGILVICLAAYLVAQGLMARWTVSAEPTEEGKLPLGAVALLLQLLMLLTGLGLLILGSEWFVSGATSIAKAFGVSDLIIGLTLVALGTSLPEVATSIVAALRGEREIAVGNVIGSNIFNILGVLGITALVAPEPIMVGTELIQDDLPIMLAVAVLCLPIFITGTRISRGEGLLFLFYYAAYTVFLVLRAQDSAFLQSYSIALVYLVLPLTGLFLVLSFFGSERFIEALAHSAPRDLEKAAWQSLRQLRKLVVLVVGSTVLLIGMVMVIAPGPATLMIPAGLAILATEFVWARRILKKVEQKIRETTGWKAKPTELAQEKVEKTLPKSLLRGGKDRSEGDEKPRE